MSATPDRQKLWLDSETFAQFEQTRWYVYVNGAEQAAFAISDKDLSTEDEAIKNVLKVALGAYQHGWKMGEVAGRRNQQRDFCRVIGAALQG